MDENYLYQQIAENIRRDILEGKLKPGDPVPSMRLLKEKWNCTVATVQRAFNELAREGLLVSQVGRGTRVASGFSRPGAQAGGPLRRAALVHQAEAFLLETLTSGYGLAEIQTAVDLAMDRWRALQASDQPFGQEGALELVRFSGSHDPLINELGRFFFGSREPGARFQAQYNGSLGGLIALAEGRADLAGCHLWDAETGAYNLPFISKVLPGADLVVMTLADRRQGLMVNPGNPLGIHSLADLAKPSVRFVNRQPGSGTRLWLDAQLEMLGILKKQVNGYDDERLTHSDAARAVAEGKASVALGLESAARAFELDFIFLNRERYDLVMPAAAAEMPSIRKLLEWLPSPEGKAFIDQHTGYDSVETGRRWL